ncbi:hypothetical protein BY996DRAFT_6500921 [Phakopsora pachyrhizi]|nr:hypothetical protein BY996DRAFT_6500921 [Phakopsora pachyrhizi]
MNRDKFNSNSGVFDILLNGLWKRQGITEVKISKNHFSKMKTREAVKKVSNKTSNIQKPVEMMEWEEGPKIFGTLRNEKERRQAIRPSSMTELRIQMAAIRERVESIAESQQWIELGTIVVGSDTSTIRLMSINTFSNPMIDPGGRTLVDGCIVNQVVSRDQQATVDRTGYNILSSRDGIADPNDSLSDFE